MMAKVHRVMDSMVGVHLNAHVMSTYVSMRDTDIGSNGRMSRWL